MHSHHKVAIVGALLAIAFGPRVAAVVLRALLIVGASLATIFVIVEISR